MAPPRPASTRGGRRPPPDPAPLRPEQELLLEAAADGDLVLFKRLAKLLDGGRGRITEAVEAVVECTAGPLHFAAGHGEVAMCRYLVEELRVDVNAIHDYGESPLAYAINGEHIATVRYLLNHGADPDKADDKGFTSLHIASEEGYCNIVELLLSNGASVDAFSNRGTPLHLAATNGHHRTVKILLDHNADCNKIVLGVYTPLLVSIYAHSLKTVKLLIKAGADVNGVGNVTPLIAAIADGLTECTKCLLEAGADPNVPDEFGRMPIEFAAIRGTREDVGILFPLTSPIPAVLDWSVNGIIRHAKSLPPQKVYESGIEKDVARLKLQASKAIEREDYLAAVELYTKQMSFHPSVAAELLKRTKVTSPFNIASTCYGPLKNCHKIPQRSPDICDRTRSSSSSCTCSGIRHGSWSSNGSGVVSSAARRRVKQEFEGCRHSSAAVRRRRRRSSSRRQAAVERVLASSRWRRRRRR